MINISDAIPVYPMQPNGAISSSQIGKITKNECFTDGAQIGPPWEGIDSPVYFLNAKHAMTFGVVLDSDCINIVNFGKYASNGTSWVKVDSLERRVEYTPQAYYANGDPCVQLDAGSRVWLTANCTRGDTNPNYIAVTKVETAKKKVYEFVGNGFIDLTYGLRWVSVGSILLRKA